MMGKASAHAPSKTKKTREIETFFLSFLQGGRCFMIMISRIYI